MMYGKGILNGNICGALIAVLATLSNASAANVVARPTASTANRVSATRPTQAAARMPTMTISTNTTTSVSTTTDTSSETTTNTETVTTTEPEPAPAETSVANKSSSFGSTLTANSSSTVDTAAATLAELVRAQRAALDAADAAAVAGTAPTLSTGSGENICDTVLRECMIQKCGSNFAKCALDTDTMFGDKLDTCRRTTNCTGHEYELFANEIKSDRDFNALVANYNATIDCGNKYDSCIVAACGATYSKCIGKSAGDDAIRKCESIAKSCTEYDSGLAMRAMAVFGDLRQTAERQIATDEQKLYALREQMRNVCTRLGAMFDERSLDCVYTVNFRAGDDATLYASKKLYAGGTFDCTPNWFGIDVTTFRENALRADREQKSASSAMLGSGLGQAVGAITSGAIDRAVARNKADNALDDAIKDCVENGIDEKTGEKMDEAACRAKIGEKASTDGKSKESKKDDKQKKQDQKEETEDNDEQHEDVPEQKPEKTESESEDNKDGNGSGAGVAKDGTSTDKKTQTDDKVSARNESGNPATITNNVIQNKPELSKQIMNSAKGTNSFASSEQNPSNQSSGATGGGERVFNKNPKTIKDVYASTDDKQASINLWKNAAANYVVTKSCSSGAGNLSCATKSLTCFNRDYTQYYRSDQLKKDIDTACTDEVQVEFTNSKKYKVTAK